MEHPLRKRKQIATTSGKSPLQTTMDKSTKKKKKKSTNRLLEQMEFYFSDSNLRRDKFLREKLILNSTRKGKLGKVWV